MRGSVDRTGSIGRGSYCSGEHPEQQMLASGFAMRLGWMATGRPPALARLRGPRPRAAPAAAPRGARRRAAGARVPPGACRTIAAPARAGPVSALFGGCVSPSQGCARCGPRSRPSRSAPDRAACEADSRHARRALPDRGGVRQLAERWGSRSTKTRRSPAPRGRRVSVCPTGCSSPRSSVRRGTPAGREGKLRARPRVREPAGARRGRRALCVPGLVALRARTWSDVAPGRAWLGPDGGPGAPSALCCARAALRPGRVRPDDGRGLRPGRASGAATFPDNDVTQVAPQVRGRGPAGRARACCARSRRSASSGGWHARHGLGRYAAIFALCRGPAREDASPCWRGLRRIA